MKTILRIMTSEHGDKAIEFDDTEATATTREEARALFERMKSAGAVTFNVTPEGRAPAQRVERFEELGEEAIIVPRIVGG